MEDSISKLMSNSWLVPSVGFADQMKSFSGDPNEKENGRVREVDLGSEESRLDKWVKREASESDIFRFVVELCGINPELDTRYWQVSEETRADSPCGFRR